MSSTKYTETGGRFWKKKTRHFISDSDIIEIKRFFSGGSIKTTSFNELLAMWSKVAVCILKSKDLPYTAIVEYETQLSNDEVLAHKDRIISYLKAKNKPCNTSAIKKRSSGDNIRHWQGYIDNYIIKICGKSHDSLEGMAAQILTIQEKYNKKQGDLSMLCYDLGQIAKLIHVDSVINKDLSNGRYRPSPNDNFTNLALRMVEQFHKTKNYEYWDMLDDGYDDNFYTGIEKNKKSREVDYLYYEDIYSKNNDEEKISKRTFIYTYIPEARKALNI